MAKLSFELKEAVNESNNELEVRLKSLNKAFSIDPDSVGRYPNPPDAEERANIEAYSADLRAHVKSLKDEAAQRDVWLNGLNSRVQEARNLCSATRTWSCRPTDPEFSTSCERWQHSETCESADRIRASKDLINSHVSRYGDLLRALEVRLKRTDSPQSDSAAPKEIEA